MNCKFPVRCIVKTFGCNRSLASCLLAVAVLLAGGCESQPSAVEANFGSSVRNIVAVQTAQPGQPAPGLDGNKAEAVLETYRGDVAKPERVERDLIQINLGK